MCPPPTEPRKQPQPQPAGPLRSSRPAGHRAGAAVAVAAGQRPSSPRPYREPVVALLRLPRPGPPPCILPQAPSSPPVCRDFPVSGERPGGAGRQERDRGGAGERCGPSPGRGGSAEPESRLSAFVWDVSGVPVG